MADVSMIDMPWRSFEMYPEDGLPVVLHLVGRDRKKNKNYHSFFNIPRFNAKTFNPREYVLDMPGVTWSFSWMYITEDM